METMNIEIKASCSNPDRIRQILKQKQALFTGIDHQIDTYFRVNNGRLKLREGNIEQNLIFYERNDIEGPKQSDVILYSSQDFSKLKKILQKSIGELIIVEKKREIFFIENIKFHIDKVKNLGSFIEIEASNKNGEVRKKLLQQCNYYIDQFQIKENEFIKRSYSDLLLDKMIEITEGSIREVVELSRHIPEFSAPYNDEEYHQRLRFVQHQILIAKFKDNAVGFKVGYRQEDHFYSWMGGVLPAYRRFGIAAKLADHQEEFCRRNQIKKIRMKTRNRHKNMLLLALNRSFRIIDIQTRDNVLENRIVLEKRLN